MNIPFYKNMLNQMEEQMKLQYLGTAAAEGWPAVFCNCEACNEARRLGGKNIRTRSQALINSDLLIDFPCDTYHHVLREGFDLSAVRHLLVTHSHTDHFYPAELVLRGSYYAHNMQSEMLHIYCNEAVKQYFYRAAAHELEPEIEAGLSFHIVKPFEAFRAGDYRVTPLPARHMDTEQALIYLIERNGRAILYAHDTGRFLPEVYAYLEKEKITLNLVSLDCTSGRIDNGENNGHMGIPDNRVVKTRLVEIGAANKETRFIMNHFSHNGGLLHDALYELGEQAGMSPAYDGMTVNV